MSGLEVAKGKPSDTEKNQHSYRHDNNRDGDDDDGDDDGDGDVHVHPEPLRRLKRNESIRMYHCNETHCRRSMPSPTRIEFVVPLGLSKLLL